MKAARPIVTKSPMHLVLRSSRAREEWSFLGRGNRGVVKQVLSETARRFRVKVHRFVNVGNHLHLLVQVQRRRDLQDFLRVFTQTLVFRITGARKGRPVGKFWDHLAFSRIVEWGRDWKNLLTYFEKNAWEAAGVPRSMVDELYRHGPPP